MSIIGAMRMAVHFIVLAVVCAATCVLRAADITSAGSTTNPTTRDSHGWIVRAAGGKRTGAVILHLPPRGADASGHPASGDGTVRRAADLAQTPEAIGAYDNRLFMVFPPEPAGRELRRTVLTFDARRGSIDGSWVGETGENRLPALPSLPGYGRVVGFAGTAAGPVALIDQGDADGLPEEHLFILIGGEWRSMNLPAGMAGRDLDPDMLEQGDTGIRLVSTPGGLSILKLDGTETGHWSCAIKERASVPGKSFEAKWTWKPLVWRNPATGEACRPRGAVFSIAGELVFDRREWESVVIYAAGSSGCRRIAEVPNVPVAYAAVPLDQTGRLAIVSWALARTPASPVGSQTETRVSEVSILTGQVLFDGAAENQPPFSSAELRLLAATLVAMMLVIVVFVLRPERTSVPLTLPRGFALAEPGRRVVAGAIDAGIALVIATRLTGVDLAEAVTFNALMRDTHTLTLFVATIGVGIGIGTLGEWLFGKTLGKLLTGCEVVCPTILKAPDGTLTPRLGRPVLWRAAIRNVVKWVIPPVAITGISAADGRHRGDIAAGTVVLIRIDPEPE